MKAFNYFQPTEIIFGAGRVAEIGEITARFGKRCLLVTVAEFPELMLTLPKQNNRRVATIDEMYNMLIKCIER